MDITFSNLLKPGNVGAMPLRNRIIFPCIAIGGGTAEGYIRDDTVGFYEERAKGGVALVIIEYTIVEPSKIFNRAVRIDSDKFIPKLAEAAWKIQKYGAKAGIQLAHGGDTARMASPDYQPPAQFSPLHGGIPEDYTVTELKRIVNSFTVAVVRAKKAGIDGVEIHAAHGTNLISRFLSSASNRRQDDYGGNVHNRMRILVEIISSVREAVGQSYPVWCRISGGGTEGIATAITPGEVREQARMLEAAGVDAISVSGYPDRQSATSPLGYFVPFAENVKKVVSIPVFVAGGITPELGEKIIGEGKTDFVAIGRGLVADPQLPKKIMEGRLKNLVRCIRCTECHPPSCVLTENGT